jgi:hypothetical protein
MIWAYCFLFFCREKLFRESWKLVFESGKPFTLHWKGLCLQNLPIIGPFESGNNSNGFQFAGLDF